MKRALRTKITTGDHSIVDRGTLPVISTQAAQYILIVGKMTDLAIEDGCVTGTLSFTGDYADASLALYETAERCELSLGSCGICITY